MANKKISDLTAAAAAAAANEYEINEAGTSKKVTGTQLAAFIHTITLGKPEVIGVAASDETSDLTVADDKVNFRMPFAMTLTEVRATVNTAPVGSTIIVDIEESGATILSTLLTIDDGEKSSTTADVPPVISDTALADDAEITINVDQIGSGTAGNGLKIWLIGKRA